MCVAPFDPDHQAILRQSAQQWIIWVLGIDPFTNGASGVADEMLIAIDVTRALNKARSVSESRYFGVFEVILAALIFGNGQATKFGVARFTQIGRNWPQVMIMHIHTKVD